MNATNKETPTIGTGIRYSGVTKTAKLLGCSAPHLSYVLHGHRVPSAALAAKLARMDIKIPARRVAKKA